MHLLNLPSETISLIFEFLGEYDLTSLILAQSVCRSLHEVVRRILFHQLGSVHRGGDINPLLIQRFNSLFDTGELSRRGVPATDSDRNQPFYRLPWAACRCAGGFISEGAMRKSPYLFPEASWRRLNIMWGMGHELRPLTSLSY